MSIKTGLDALNDNLESINNLKNSFITKLIADGSDITSDASFIDIANAIYNLGYESDKKSFISADFSHFPSGTGINGILNKCGFLYVVRDAIFNALRARGEEGFNKNLNSMLELLDSPEFGDRADPIAVTLTALTIDSMRVALPEGNNFVYTLSTSTNWQSIITGTVLTGLKDTDYITIRNTETGNVFLGTVVLSNKEVAPTADVSSSYGTKYGYTHIVVNNPTGLVYYSFVKRQDVYYRSEKVNLDEYRKLSVLDTELRAESDTLYVVELSGDNRVISASSTPLMIKQKCPTIKVESVADPSELHGTHINVTNILATGNKYVYVNRAYEPFYDEDLTSLEGLEQWDGSSLLVLPNNSAFTIFEATSANHARKYGQCVVESYSPNLSVIQFTSTATDNFSETKINITTPKYSNTDERYYTFSDTYIDEPKFGDPVDKSIYTKITTNPFYIENIRNGSYIRIVETDHDLIIATGFVTAKALIPYMEQLAISSSWGRSKGSTKLTIRPYIAQGNIYLIAHGNRPVHYDEFLENFTLWDGLSDIYGFTDMEICTVVEATPDWRAKKIGVVSMTPRPLELYDLDVSSRRGTLPGCTILYVSPAIESGNEYRYIVADDVVKVVLDQNIGGWKSWDGVSELAAEDNKVITLVECSAEHLARKAGNCVVKSKET